jgi:hypothetical protein
MLFIVIAIFLCSSAKKSKKDAIQKSTFSIATCCNDHSFRWLQKPKVALAAWSNSRIIKIGSYWNHDFMEFDGAW